MGTQTAEEKLRSLGSVQDTFLATGARLKLSKCTFETREVELLRHRIGKCSAIRVFTGGEVKRK